MGIIGNIFILIISHLSFSRTSHDAILINIRWTLVNRKKREKKNNHMDWKTLIIQSNQKDIIKLKKKKKI